MRDRLVGAALQDARMLHATHPNSSDSHRTVITLWFQPNYKNLPLKTQAQMLTKTMVLPRSWEKLEGYEKLRQMMPAYHWEQSGRADVESVVLEEDLDLSRQLYRRKPSPLTRYRDVVSPEVASKQN
jgi:hypothetical protein